ncbi:MAG TPA: helix-turn-helix domain-containing protein [Candidatus Nanoarchaeia archaeon]|nr:helix-turn-helix domain-containing protein [Candidatus Nanoarchaeia archaeon]
MIVQKEYLNRIKDDFKLNIYEVKIWTALLSRGIATAGELADISSVPRSRCYDVLESLEKKGFIIMKIGKPIKYIAVHPEEIVARVKKSLEEESVRNIEMYETLRETDLFKELQMLHKSGIEHIDASDISKSIVGRGAINHAVRDMLNKTKGDVIISSSESTFMRDVGHLKAILNGLNKRGIKVRVIAPVRESLAKKFNVKNLETREFSSRFFIAGDEFLFIITNESATADYETAVWVQSKFFSKSMSLLIDRIKP